jgi:hypothetical protein
MAVFAALSMFRGLRRNIVAWRLTPRLLLFAAHAALGLREAAISQPRSTIFVLIQVIGPLFIWRLNC